MACRVGRSVPNSAGAHVVRWVVDSVVPPGVLSGGRLIRSCRPAACRLLGGRFGCAARCVVRWAVDSVVPSGGMSSLGWSIRLCRPVCRPVSGRLVLAIDVPSGERSARVHHLDVSTIGRSVRAERLCARCWVVSSRRLPEKCVVPLAVGFMFQRPHDVPEPACRPLDGRLGPADQVLDVRWPDWAGRPGCVGRWTVGSGGRPCVGRRVVRSWRLSERVVQWAVGLSVRRRWVVRLMAGSCVLTG